MDTTVSGNGAAQVRFADLARDPSDEIRTTVGLAELLALIKTRRRLIGIVAGLGFVLLILAVALMQTNYSATASVVLESSTVPLLDSVTSIAGQTRDRSSVETEMDIISSRELAGRVVDTLDLTGNPTFNPAVAAASQTGPVAAVGRAIGSAVARLERMIDPGPPKPAAPDPARQRDAAISALLGHMSVTRNDESLAIDIQMTSPDPALSASIANAVADTYVAWTHERKERGLDDAVAMLRKRAERIATDIAQNEQAINRFTNSNNLSTDSRDDLVRQRIDGMNSQLTTARVNLADIRAQVSQGKDVMSGEMTLDGTNLSSPLLAALRTQKSDLQRQRALNAINLGPNHPAVRQLDAQIDSVDSMIASELQHLVTDLSGQEKIAAARVDDLQGQVGKLRTELQDRRSAESHLRELQRKLTADQDLQTFVVSQLGRLDPFAKLAAAGARVVSRAAVPTQASFPHRSRILAGGILGVIVLAVLAGVLVDASDTTVRTGRLARSITGVPNLMSLPRPYGRGGADGSMLQPFVDRVPSAQSEAFRSLYLACRTYLPGRHSVVLVTTPRQVRHLPDFALGLACAAVADGVKTVYLDLDPPAVDAGVLKGRMPRVTVEDVVAGRRGFDEALAVINEVGGLSVLRSAGPLNSLSRAVTFESMRDFVGTLRGSYDLVVVNCAALLSVNDAHWLSPLVDAVILGLRSGKTSCDDLREAVESLRASHAPLIGTALSLTDGGSGVPRVKKRRSVSAPRGTSTKSPGGAVA